MSKGNPYGSYPEDRKAYRDSIAAEKQLLTAMRLRAEQREADKIAALIATAYRRGFEDGWRESKLEVVP